MTSYLFSLRPEKTAFGLRYIQASSVPKLMRVYKKLQGFLNWNQDFGEVKALKHSLKDTLQGSIVDGVSMTKEISVKFETFYNSGRLLESLT